MESLQPGRDTRREKRKPSWAATRKAPCGLWPGRSGWGKGRPGKEPTDQPHPPLTPLQPMPPPATPVPPRSPGLSCHLLSSPGLWELLLCPLRGSAVPDSVQLSHLLPTHLQLPGQISPSSLEPGLLLQPGQLCAQLLTAACPRAARWPSVCL